MSRGLYVCLRVKVLCVCRATVILELSTAARASFFDPASGNTLPSLRPQQSRCLIALCSDSQDVKVVMRSALIDY